MIDLRDAIVETIEEEGHHHQANASGVEKQVIGLGIALIKEVETEVDLEIEIKTEEKVDVLLARKRDTRLETVKKEAVEEEEDLDQDLIPGPTEGDIVEETTLDLIPETEEDLEEETLETEGQDLQNLEIEDHPEILVTEEETTKAFHQTPLIVKTAETEGHSEETQKKDSHRIDLLVKTVKKEELKEKVFQEVIPRGMLKEVKEELKETVLTNKKCLKVK